MEEFVTYKSFYSETDAIELSMLLNENKIENKVERIKPLVDPLIGGDDLGKEFCVKIKSNDFKNANDLLDHLISKNISAIDKDYYLFSFTDTELREIINKPDEWNNQDVLLARKLLKDRGVEITDNEFAEIKSRRYYQLAKPEKVSYNKIFWGYIMAIFFPPIGMIVGLVFLNTKTFLPDGNKVNSFDEKARNHGLNICIIGGIMLGLLLIGSLVTHLI
jgi:hypothetical protein